MPFLPEGSKEIPIVDKSRIKMPHHPAGAMERDEANHMIGTEWLLKSFALFGQLGWIRTERQRVPVEQMAQRPPSLPPSQWTQQSPWGGWRDVIAGSLFKKLRSEKRQRKFSSKQHPREREALENAALFSEHSEWPGTEPPI